MAIKKVCGNCRSDQCGFDATARWNVDLQQFELSGIQDNAFCDNCDADDPDILDIEITCLNLSSELGVLIQQHLLDGRSSLRLVSVDDSAQECFIFAPVNGVRKYGVIEHYRYIKADNQFVCLAALRATPQQVRKYS